MMRFAVVFGALFAMATSQNAAISPCTVNSGQFPLMAQIEGCTTAPCALPQLQDAVIDVVFRAPRAIESMRTLATAFLSFGAINIPVPYDLDENSVTCNFLTNAHCPLATGQIVHYQLKMFIEPFFPVGIQTTVEFRMVDQNNAPVSCLRVPITIVAPRAKTIDSDVVGDIEQQ